MRCLALLFMNLFLIGDVHGCYYTFQALLRYWQPQEELLIQVGDLVDRGNFAPETVAMAMEVHADYPGQTVFLRGNHEAGMIRHYGSDGPFPEWLNWGGRTTVHQYDQQPSLLQPHLRWLAQRPLIWENDHVVVSHAGLADTDDPYDEENLDGVLWRRGPLRNVGKLQVIGHTPTPNGLPLFDRLSHTLSIDTGAYLGRVLTGVKLTAEGEILQIVAIPVEAADIS
ncbi:serine/threonine protein phosphatase [Hymenobacter cavernae]|uniref:Serine/threonine protein phosphatase n=2 Tax=Hymenobacter cavernae TaxID=2044852 RepID=A0ABQ1UQA7_9BACT|nr:serine/threonine protein phosphatase [Hymenobacter cavernae]